MDYKKLKEEASKAYHTIRGDISELVDKTITRGKEIDASIEAQGGYTKVAKETIDNTVNKTVKKISVDLSL